MITLASYYNGRDKQYAHEFTDEIQRNATLTVFRTNELLARAGRSDINTVASGWRPTAINDSTNNAAASSRHITAEACDIADPDRLLAEWCVDNLDVLEELGLWMEHPGWTWSANGNHWLHVQTVPPKSGKRVFIPNSKKPGDPSFQV